MSQIFRLSKNPGTTKTDNRLDLLSPLHDVVQVVQSAGDLSPFPYVSQAAGVVLVVLDVIQVCLPTVFFPAYSHHRSTEGTPKQGRLQRVSGNYRRNYRHRTRRGCV